MTNYYRLTNPQELDVSLYQPEPEELPQPEESRPERLTNQQAREYYNKAASVDRELETLVNQYKLGQISENEYLEERTLLLDSYADVLSGLFMGTLSLEGRTMLPSWRRPNTTWRRITLRPPRSVWNGISAMGI